MSLNSNYQQTDWYKSNNLNTANLARNLEKIDSAILDLEAREQHTHANKEVLDTITAGDITNWNGKSTVIVPAASTSTIEAHALNIDGVEYKIPVEEKVSSITAWNQELMAGTVTPDITLPTPNTQKVESITYTFTAETANASFTAPASWILVDDNGVGTLAAGNTLAYSDLTIGSVYKCSFKPVSASLIRIVMLETKM